MIQCIATDLDRTLLRDDKSISPFTQEVLARCRARGVKLVFATARPLEQIKALCKSIPFDGAVTLNGGAVYAEGTYLHKVTFDPAAQEDMLCMIASDKSVTRISGNCSAYQAGGKVPHEPLSMISFRSPDPALAKAIRAKYPGLTIYTTAEQSDLYDVAPPGATKWDSLQYLMRHWNIPASEIAAFGDDLNDIEMLRNCGTGIAVANALEEVKAVANEVCGSNEEDGVARWILSAVPQLK